MDFWDPIGCVLEFNDDFSWRAGANKNLELISK